MGIISNNQKNALKEFIRFNREVSEETFWDMVEEKELNQYNVDDFIKSYLDEKGLELIDLKTAENKAVRDELISLLQEKSNISLRGIADLLGLGSEAVRKSCCQ